ncbi:MAG: DUF308 domain-containing protein [Bacteroidales bacterium]|nr:DUF308 domain-containing protein [Bacteroidales bacterium]
MKTINNSVLRSVFAVVLGLVLVVWPATAINYLVITIGILFIIPGLIAMIGYFATKKRNQENGISTMFPIEGAGSTLFGIWLVVMPAFFVNILMYVLGVLLLIAGIQQIAMLFSARRWTRVAGGYYLMPILILILGIIILTYPFAVATNTFILLGATSICYGIFELINWFRFKNLNRESLPE